MDYAIKLKNVTKKYKLYANRKERILDLLLPKEYGEDFFALNGVNFQAEKGDTIGFVGINGSGKSTMLNIISGVVPETAGEIDVKGQSALISVASGLKGDLTGRENIELKCLMLGFSQEEIKVLEPKIIEFSELGKFIDQPIKTYSSGMKSRLGFGISINVNPDILIIDEALSVGDTAFSQKCLDKINEFKKQGKTILFVSHSAAQVKEFCDKILWLEYGKVRQYGDTKEVMKEYESFTNWYKKLNAKEKKEYREQKEMNSLS